MAKQFAVIGMGRFGSSVARTLYEKGFDVLGIDSDEERIQDTVDLVTHAVTADSTDENALKSIGIRNFDVVVVAIGNDVKNSILTTLILKELGVRHIVVKAQDEMHGKVLGKIGADRVVYPERDMGQRVAQHLTSPNILDYIELADDYSIRELQVPTKFIGRSLEQIDIRRKYGCNVIAIKHGGKINISPIATDIFHEGDVLVVVGENKDLDDLDEIK